MALTVALTIAPHDCPSRLPLTMALNPPHRARRHARGLPQALDDLARADEARAPRHRQDSLRVGRRPRGDGRVSGHRAFRER
eukprot:5149689-Prymnesium_polylepis.1